MAKAIQYRGNCQLCGAQHAIGGNGRGTVAKHGYTVEHGWFQGVCNGSAVQPMQKDRTVTDQMVADVRKQVADLTQRAADMKSGKVTPETCGSGEYKWEGMRRIEIQIPFAQGRQYSQDEAVRNEIYRAESRARAGTSFANDMEALVNRVHGQPLVEVTKADRPAPILPGEQRKTEGGYIATVKYQEGARVYWTYESDGRERTTWTGTTSWRKLELLKTGGY